MGRGDDGSDGPFTRLVNLFWAKALLRDVLFTILLMILFMPEMGSVAGLKHVLLLSRIYFGFNACSPVAFKLRFF